MYMWVVMNRKPPSSIHSEAQNQCYGLKLQEAGIQRQPRRMSEVKTDKSDMMTTMPISEESKIAYAEALGEAVMERKNTTVE